MRYLEAANQRGLHSEGFLFPIGAENVEMVDETTGIDSDLGVCTANKSANWKTQRDALIPVVFRHTGI